MYLSRSKNLTHSSVILLDEYTHGDKACPSHAPALGLERAERAPRQSQPVPGFGCVCPQGLMHVDTILPCKPSLPQVLLLAAVSACISVLPSINLSCCKVQINVYSVPLIYMLCPVNTDLPMCASTEFYINLPSECSSVSLV